MTHVSLKTAAEDKACGDVAKSVPTFTVNPRTVVVVKGFNGRPINRDHVEVLKAAWRAGKTQTPPFNPFPELTLRVVDGERRLVDGEHRLTAYLELIEEGEPIERVPCKEFKGSDKDALLHMLGANSGLGWTMMQLGAKYAEAVNMHGLSYAEVAAARGMSIQHVKDCMRLLEQPEEIKEAVRSNVISGSQAMKVVKAMGSTAAVEAIAAAREEAPKSGVKAGRITQKALDKAGRRTVDGRLEAGKQCKDHLAAMLESPSFTREQKDAMRKVMKAIGGRLPDLAPDIDHVGEWLNEAALNSNDMVKESAKLLIKHRAKGFIPSNGSEQAKYYGHMCWLQDMAANRTAPVRASAAHWFLAAFDATRTGRDAEQVAPPPSVLTLDAAIRMEIDSAGQVNAESMCPEHADLVGYLRRGAAR